MHDILLTEGQRLLRDEARAFVRDEVPRQLLLDMDADRLRYPREYLRKLAARRLFSACASRGSSAGADWIDGPEPKADERCHWRRRKIAARDRR